MNANRFLGSGLLVLGVFTAMPAVAKADPGLDVSIVLGGGDYGRGGRDSRGGCGYGLERGRSEGAERGYRDARRGDRFEVRRDSWYRDGDRGYKGWMGPRGQYAAGYRQGFEAAYRRAFASARDDRHGRDRGYDRDRERDDRGYDRERDDRRDDWRR
jgi:hypothetical protein